MSEKESEVQELRNQVSLLERDRLDLEGMVYLARISFEAIFGDGDWTNEGFSVEGHAQAVSQAGVFLRVAEATNIRRENRLIEKESGLE